MTYEQRIMIIGDAIDKQLRAIGATEEVSELFERLAAIQEIGNTFYKFVSEGDIFTIPGSDVMELAKPAAVAETASTPTEPEQTPVVETPAEPEPVKEEPKPEPVAEEPKTAAEIPDRTEVRRKLVLAQKNGVDVKALIASFGANKLSDVKDSDLAELLEKAGV